MGLLQANRITLINCFSKRYVFYYVFSSSSSRRMCVCVCFGDDEKMVVLRRAFVRWRMSSLERKRNRTEKKNVELELRCDEVITMKEREREKTSMQRLCLHILRKAALKEIDGGENYNHVSDDDIIRRELLRSILLKQRKMLVDEINRIER